LEREGVTLLARFFCAKAREADVVDFMGDMRR
jgi:hypothetical protein